MNLRPALSVFLAQLRHAIYFSIHGSCDRHAAQSYWLGYVKGAQDERSLMLNARLERELRQLLADAERPAS